MTVALGNDGKLRLFNHPIVQAAMFMMGQTVCYFVYHFVIQRSKSPSTSSSAPATSDHHSNAPSRVDSTYSVTIFILPSFLDFLGTIIMRYGLLFLYSSTFQMLRGAAIFFTAILSMLFLHQRLSGYHWIGIGVIISGLLLVGIAAAVAGSDGVRASDPIAGVILIVFAQLLVACQTVTEEYYVHKHNLHPLYIVGWEGLWGLIISAVTLIAAYYTPGWTDSNRLEDVLDAYTQISNSGVLTGVLFSTIFVVAVYSGTGMIIIKKLSATTRMVVDSIRTLLVWIVALCLQWEIFRPFQILGFAILIIGFFVYVGTIPLDFIGFPKPAVEAAVPDDEETEPLNQA